MHSKKELLEDIYKIQVMAIEKDYSLGFKDVFALGYMCGKYGVNKIIGNQEALMAACVQYDATDDLGLYDTIGETLIDLKVLDNSKGEI